VFIIRVLIVALQECTCCALVVKITFSLQLLGQAEAGTDDEVYGQVSLTPASEVSIVQVACIVLASKY
jgi:hypothetical protein